MDTTQDGIVDGKTMDDNVRKATVSSLYQNDKPVMREDAIAARLAAMLDAGVKLSSMAVEASVTKDEIEAWINGHRAEKITLALSKWLVGIDKDIAERNGNFFMSPSAENFIRAFEHAREAKNSEGARGIAMIYGASGTGKSVTAKWLARMDENVIYVQADGERRTWTGLLKGVVESMGRAGYPAAGEKLSEFVRNRIEPGGLLIFDHAQLIRLSVMEQFLVFPDEHGIALAFIGNTKGYNSFVNAKLAHINSRIRGSIVFVEMPGEDDVDAMMAAREVGGRKEREFCLMIGRQDGGLRYLDAAILEAKKIAHASGAKKIDLRLLKLGAANAGCWGGVA